ncbi:MAG: NusG domain II-containing protein [Erysipelotrichaceae bacterium]
MMISSILMYSSMEWLVHASTSSHNVAVVTYHDKVVLRVDMKVNKNYTVQGALGEVIIEVSKGQVRVEKETSPYHLCSIQGWVKYANVPIVCLPNYIVVMIKNGTVNPDGTDVNTK